MAENNEGASFGREELESLARAVTRAEELVGEHFRLRSPEADFGHYDVLSVVDHGCQPAGEGAMAEVVQCSSLEAVPSWSARSRSFFRIHLYDGHIKDFLRRLEDFGVTLDDVLLYIITHELVHVVRFSRFLGRFHAASPHRCDEEFKVEEETRKIIQKIKEPGIVALLDHTAGQWGG